MVASNEICSKFSPMKRLILLLMLMTGAQVLAQVGVGTTNPQSNLDIPATNAAAPTATDGLLIPRVSAFPAANPAAAQNGMMLFLTADLPGKPKGFYYWDNATTSWIGVGGGKGWELTGNAGTNPATNFLGTTDNQDVVFKRQNQRAGLLTNIPSNTAFGVSGLAALSAGTGNTAFGKQALAANTTGSDNTAVGNQALMNNLSSIGNVGIGTQALMNTEAGDNTAVGSSAMTTNTAGYANVAVGKSALTANTAGFQNTAVGFEALSANTWGYMNTAVGYQSQKNTVTSPNTSIGAWSLLNNTLGQNNVALGGAALYGNQQGNANVGVGSNALAANILGSGNAALGDNALTAVAGDNNVGIGASAGTGLTSGSNNIAIGAAAALPSNTGSNQLSLGNTVYGTNVGSTALSKIGVNEPAPAAKFHISPSSSATPNNTDGFIMPRVSNFPAVNPGADQNGMTLFLTANAGSFTKGFYYWDHPNLKWVKIGEGNPTYYNVVGTTNITATTTTQPMAQMTQTFTPKSPVVIVDFSAAGFSITNSCGQQAAYFTLLLDGVPVKNFQTSIEDITAMPRPMWDIYFTYPVSLTTGVPHTISINWFTPNCNSMGNFVTTPHMNAQAHRMLQIMDYDGGGGIVASVTPPVTSEVWSVNGNSGLNGNTQFLGTVDDVNLTFKRNSVNVGRFFPTSLGLGALTLQNNTGGNNVALGNNAMAYTNAGSNGTALGAYAMGNMTNTPTAFTNMNVAVGYYSLYGSGANFTNTGNENTAVGYHSLRVNATGSFNTALGTDALASNGAGNYNTAIGHHSLDSALDGGENTALGVNTMQAATTGNYNTIVGTNALYSSTTPQNNTAVGHSALFSNLTGAGNVALGFQAGYGETGSNKLYIENGPSATPLIYGDFATDLLRVHGHTESIYTQLTANGDNQSSLYGYRTRDSRNDGTSYTVAGTNKAVAGYNFWGDSYTFGVTGHCYNDFVRSGGVLGSNVGGNIWASLGYFSSTSTNYGIYASTASGTGTGRMASGAAQNTIGGGFYGGLIGSWSKGSRIGHIASGSQFAAYNSGDEYTAGKQIELVPTGNSRTAAYSVTSTDVVVYKKGKANLTAGTVRVNFDAAYAKLLGDVPVVTVTPMGNCNGIYIESIDAAGFTLRELGNGSSNVAVSWIAVGDRVDAAHAVSPELLTQDFDDNLNEVMFNENEKDRSGKAIWSESGQLRMGQMPAHLVEKPVRTQP